MRLTCVGRPSYVFTADRHALEIGADIVQMKVRMAKGGDPCTRMELVVGETLSFKTGLLCTVVSVSFGVSGRTAKVLTRVIFLA